MIQDIYPSKLDNAFAKPKPSENDPVMVFDEEGRLLARNEEGRIVFPTVSEAGGELRYLFAVDSARCFLSCSPGDISDYDPFPVRKLRDTGEGKELFAAFTAYHLWKWYTDNRFCGRCGSVLEDDDRERALRCSKCGNIVYPRINPAVIVGVINGDSILITRYRRGDAHNALIAGFAEIGETLEETVAREVMEEAGIKVRNIRYYKSQPWGMAQDLLTGFYCEADGDVTIRMDEGELRSAEWTKREDIELQPNALSLTNEMMYMFKTGKEGKR